MGEEFAASTPFLFFCDFGPDLARAVAQGRRREFKRFAAFTDDAAVATIPDPGAARTFDASKLRWEERAQAPHTGRLELVRKLLALRRRYLTPHIRHIGHGGFWIEGALLHLEWKLSGTAGWRVLAHFGSDRAAASRPPGEIVFASGVQEEVASSVRLEAGAVLVVHEPCESRESA
jgi:maltooligosyltrehalose trehalohydrolase